MATSPFHADGLRGTRRETAAAATLEYVQNHPECGVESAENNSKLQCELKPATNAPAGVHLVPLVGSNSRQSYEPFFFSDFCVLLGGKHYSVNGKKEEQDQGLMQGKANPNTVGQFESSESYRITSRKSLFVSKDALKRQCTEATTRRIKAECL